MKFLNRKALKAARSIRVGTFLLFIAGALMKSYLVMGIAVVGELAAIIYFRKFNRCPHCGGYIPNISTVGNDAGYCHHCNEKMEFDS